MPGLSMLDDIDNRTKASNQLKKEMGFKEGLLDIGDSKKFHEALEKKNRPPLQNHTSPEMPKGKWPVIGKGVPKFNQREAVLKTPQGPSYAPVKTVFKPTGQGPWDRAREKSGLNTWEQDTPSPASSPKNNLSFKPTGKGPWERAREATKPKAAVPQQNVPQKGVPDYSARDKNGPVDSRYRDYKRKHYDDLNKKFPGNNIEENANESIADRLSNAGKRNGGFFHDLFQKFRKTIGFKEGGLVNHPYREKNKSTMPRSCEPRSMSKNCRSKTDEFRSHFS